MSKGTQRPLTKRLQDFAPAITVFRRDNSVVVVQLDPVSGGHFQDLFNTTVSQNERMALTPLARMWPVLVAQNHLHEMRETALCGSSVL